METKTFTKRRSTKWRLSNPEKALACQSKWRQSNLEQARQAVRTWRKSNREKMLFYQRKWRKANPEKARAATNKWHSNNPQVQIIRNALKRPATRSVMDRFKIIRTTENLSQAVNQ